ncbi:MAG: hypothetical protein AAB388_01525 [Patescibacteria group bacterium]
MSRLGVQEIQEIEESAKSSAAGTKLTFNAILGMIMLAALAPGLIRLFFTDAGHTLAETSETMVFFVAAATLKYIRKG